MSSLQVNTDLQNSSLLSDKPFLSTLSSLSWLVVIFSVCINGSLLILYNFSLSSQDALCFPIDWSKGNKITVNKKLTDNQ